MSVVDNILKDLTHTLIRNKIWTRITDRRKAPRRWWYPESNKKDCRHPDVVKMLHESYSKMINKTMLSILVVGLYCLLAVISASDKLLIITNGTIHAPLVGTSISFGAFLIVAPFLLVILTLYLHVVFGYWLQLEKERQLLNNDPKRRGEPTIESIPVIFSFIDRLSRFATSFVFYWFVPCELVGYGI